jgi:lipopolysaccharide export LptBFGC system permease protein LptF
LGTLDRYIARQYLTNMAILFVGLLGFVIVVDTAYNLDRFYDAASRLSAASGDDSPLRRVLMTMSGVAELWWPRGVYLFSMMLGLMLIAGMGFTLNQMIRHREMVATLAGGVSLQRLARPIFMVAAGLSLVSLANQELVIPRVAPLLMRDQGDVGVQQLAAQRLPMTADAQGRVFYATSYDPAKQRLTRLFVIERDLQTGLAQREITADAATWSEQGGVGAWELVNGRTRGDGESVRPVDRIETSLGPLAMQVRLYERLAGMISIRQAVWASRQTEAMSGGDVGASERAQRVVDAMTRTALGRVAAVATNLVVLAIAMCFFLSRLPQNMFVQAVKAAPLGVIGTLGGMIATAIEIPGLPAAISVFVPVLILAPVAVAMWYRVRT